MATNIDTGVTSAGALLGNQPPHIFAMSDGNLVAVYFNGTNWGYRIKSGGTWGSFTSLATLPTTGVDLGSASDRNGDTIFFGTGSNTVSFRVAKLVYSGGSITATYSPDNADTAPVISVYYDGTNAHVHALFRLNDVGMYIRGFLVSTMANAEGAVAVTGSPADSGGNQKYNTYDVAGDGTSTFLAVMNNTTGATAVVVTRISSNGTTYTQTAETGVTALAANCAGLTCCYDGTNFTFIANENNAKIRAMLRTGINTYGSWSDIESATVALAPSVCAFASGNLFAAYRRNSGQANGEIYYARRSGGVWDAAAVLAGGASTGWQTPSCAKSDANELVDTVRVVYLTGTATPWALVEEVSQGIELTTVRPDGDIDTTGWATAPLWSKIDEDPAGGDVITATAS